MGTQVSKVSDKNIPLSRDIGGGVRISAQCEDNDVRGYKDGDPKTAYEAFLRGHRESNDGPFLGSRNSPNGPYEWKSYSEVFELCDAFGGGLLNECGLVAENRIMVGIFSDNRVEWVVTDQACVRFSMVVVPLYSTLGVEACEHIINETELTVIVCDNQKKAHTICCMAANLKTLRHLVIMDSVDEETKEKVSACNWILHSFDNLLESGRQNPHELSPAKADDIYTICYTSGTTGIPKGVVFTHKSLFLNVNTLLNLFIDHRLKDYYSKDATNFSYLPLAHAYEKINLLLTAMNGGRSGFYSGDITRLFDDIQALRPTTLTAVPRVLYKVYDKVFSQARQSYIKQALLERAVASKMSDLNNGILRSDTFWDHWVFYKIREVFGGRVKLLITGSAPLDPEVMNFFRVALSSIVLSGYGQTEVCCASISAPFDFSGDHVGPPMPCNLIKLIDVPDLNYRAEDGFGEICIKGDNSFKEYYKRPEETANTKDEDGWVHTGDIGTWTPEGNLQIVDRCKQIFKLSQGEYLAPQKLEGIYLRCTLVSQIFVDGQSDKDYAVAVVVPDFDELAIALSVTNAIPDTLCESPLTKSKILEEMETVGRAAGLKGFEIVRKIFLCSEPFSQENGLLTVTMKSKRNELRKRFSSNIKSLYDHAS